MIIILFMLIPFCYTLNIQQWNSIRYILQHPESSNELKKEVKNIIFYENIPWAYYTTFKFKNQNKILNNINKEQTNELALYAVEGLHKSIKNYNGSSPFYVYAQIFLKSSLYRGITELNSIRLLPHYYYVDRKWKNKYKRIYNIYNKSPIYNDIEYIISCQNKENKNIQKILNEIMYDLEPEERRLFNYYYDIETMSKKHTISEITQLMCYSKATCQTKITKLKEKIKLLYNDYI